MPSWPASFPQKQFLGTTDQAKDVILRTPMDSGPGTRRNRFTSFPRDVTCPIVMNGTQRQAFDTWFHGDLKNGALSFTWEDPATDLSVSFAFRGPVSWKLRRGGTPATRIWMGSLELEIQP